MENKVTQKSAIEYVLATYGEEMPIDIVDKFKSMIVALEKKSNAPRNPSADVIANKGLRKDILEAMEVGKRYTINDLIAIVPSLAGATSHKVSALLTPMKREGLIVREEIKRKAYFSKA